jgi:hypothetical protein
MKLYQTCTGRTEWPKNEAREAWLAVGTRAGKSYIVALLAVFLAIFRSYHLSAGERGFIIIVSVTRKQAGIIKNYLSSFFNDNPFLKPFLVKETVDGIELTNRIVIAPMASDYKSLRGFTAVAAIVDEVAYLSIEGARPDTEVIRALRSRLMSTGGPLFAISSPYSRKGELYKTYTRHYGKNGSPILFWQASSQQMNPTLNSEAIAQAYEEDKSGADADYGGNFRADLEDFISKEALETVIVPGRRELPLIKGVKYYGFTDPSGGASDSFTLGIAHEDHGVRVLDCLRERRPHFSPDDVVKEFADTLKSYGLNTVHGDRYAGEWPRERFSVHGINYKVCEQCKSDLYLSLLPLINSKRVELLDNPTLTTQLGNLERRTSRSGKDSVDHPSRGRDDACNSAAGALVGCGKIVKIASWGDVEEDSVKHETMFSHCGLDRIFGSRNRNYDPDF